ncbi:dihydrolipoamide acetyltransferase family protein [Branchiibius cervicis]|uniref:Dihydrolipoamide acetyltransferase component of pyruvate dehydrogenase complex n=1 Tax=Branchiibius cervicis TaxID=908252 RepID=A0ABW2ATA3_9MICO
MASYFRMPGVSADSDEAILESWMVEAGAEISKDQTIATVETEKALVEVSADSDGIVHTLLVDGGATVPVGDPIAVILAVGEPAAAAEELVAALGGEPASAPEPTAPAPPEPSVPVAVTPAPAAPSAAAPVPERELVGAGTAGRRFSSPSARRVARELGVDIDRVDGSGPRGRIVRADVEAAAAAGTAPETSAPSAAPVAQPAPSPQTVSSAYDGWEAVPHTKLRRLVAGRLQQSKQTAPHFYLRASVRMDAVLALRAEINASRDQRISVNDFIVKAAALALLDVPGMNVVWTDDAILRAPRADVAVAVASERGLVTPVITDAGSLSLSTLSARIKDAADRAGEGRLNQSELEGGTLTVSNLGMYGIEEFDAIINPPHAGILAVGAAVPKAVVTDDGQLEVGTVMSVVLSVDHRPVDGALGAQWLARFKQLMQQPMLLLV